MFGEARAGFGSVADGFEQLKTHVLAIEPTVILLNYGANESFAGPAGLDTFVAGLNVLLQTLDATKARIVFLAPPPHEDLGRPLPDPLEHNHNLKLYTDAIARVAAERHAPLVNLFALLGTRFQPPAAAPLTDNGIHLNAYGYWRAATVIDHALGFSPRRWHIDVDLARRNISANGSTVSQPQLFNRHREFSGSRPGPSAVPRPRGLAAGSNP